MAGYKPAAMPTAEQMMMPIEMIFQGMKNGVSIRLPTRFPMITPSKIPITAPMRLIRVDSKRN